MLPWSCTGDYRLTSAAKPFLSCVYLFACSMEAFNNLVIFIKGSRLYGRLDFADSILDNGKHYQYILSICS